MTAEARRQDLPELLWLDPDEPDDVHDAARPVRVATGWPGEPGLWVFLLGDMSLFGAFFVAFLVYERRDRQGFSTASHELIRSLGAVNTLVLLTSSLLVVLATRALESERGSQARRLLTGALACAGAFVAVKAVEWGSLITDGHTPSSSRFFLFYFVLTGVHLLHVLVGAALLQWRRRRAAGAEPWPQVRVGVEAAAVYWHMVDLLWVVIFTLLYVVSSR